MTATQLTENKAVFRRNTFALLLPYYKHDDESPEERILDKLRKGICGINCNM